MLIETVAAFIVLEIASGFLKENGKEIYQKTKALLTPEELITLDLLEQVPDSPNLQAEVTAALEKHLEAKPDLTEELNRLVEQYKNSGGQTSINRQLGSENYNIQNSPNSKIDRR